ncbi:hypothetical protein [Sphingomonas endophytica]|uniref:hypothetical protein n=1 Tax=Sphingomonas endophytica TaxID=869719 RepID=UPI000AA58968|nr:hypothetical protein [Sphingomonas endophytica]
MADLPTHIETYDPKLNDLAINDRSRFRGSANGGAVATDLGGGLVQISYVDGFSAPMKPKTWL